MKKKTAAAAVSDGAVERPWAFEIGQVVATPSGTGDVVWRRELPSGDREYEIKTGAGAIWTPEAQISARAK